MGIDADSVRFLAYARTLGVDYARTAMIGRQGLATDVDDMRAVLADFELPSDAASVAALYTGNAGFADDFFRHLGASEVESFDYSDYEGATHVHDMNQPLPVRFKGAYSVVIDGGSLEHVFNFPVALKNCMEMVETGGHFIGMTPANNYFGHGFYQFSPELFFSALTPANGFEVVTVIAYEMGARRRWYEVRDPNAVRRRVTLVNGVPVLLFVLAKKVAEVEVFKTPPQQSDYVQAWDDKKDAPPDGRTNGAVVGAGSGSFASRIKGRLPEGWKGGLRRARRGMRSVAGVVLAPVRSVREAGRKLRPGFDPALFRKMPLPSARRPTGNP